MRQIVFIVMNMMFVCSLYSQQRATVACVLSVGNRHLFQEGWNPYREQPYLAVSIQKKTKSGLAWQAGLSVSLDVINNCDSCATSGSLESTTADAGIAALYFTAGKWWLKENKSAYLLGGIIAGMSEYGTYIRTPTIWDYYDFKTSSRGHVGAIFQSGLNWKVKDQFYMGPFIEFIISTAQRKENVSLNMNSATVGISFIIP